MLYAFVHILHSNRNLCSPQKFLHMLQNSAIIFCVVKTSLPGSSLPCLALPPPLHYLSAESASLFSVSPMHFVHYLHCSIYYTIAQFFFTQLSAVSFINHLERNDRIFFLILSKVYSNLYLEHSRHFQNMC